MPAEVNCLSAFDPSDVPNRASFTTQKNPFLYPLNLLDRALGCTSRDAASVTNSFAEAESTASWPDCVWWLLHTKPRQEKKLANELRYSEVPHFLPVTKCKALTRGRTRITLEPQFPGYLFMAGNAEQRLAALKTNRVVATHRIAEAFNLCRQLWELADLIEKDVPLRIEERLVAGQHVRVKAGLLKDKRGIIMMRGGKTRIFLFVAELLGGVSLEIDQHLLELY